MYLHLCLDEGEAAEAGRTEVEEGLRGEAIRLMATLREGGESITVESGSSAQADRTR